MRVGWFSLIYPTVIYYKNSFPSRTFMRNRTRVFGGSTSEKYHAVASTQLATQRETARLTYYYCPYTSKLNCTIQTPARYDVKYDAKALISVLIAHFGGVDAVLHRSLIWLYCTHMCTIALFTKTSQKCYCTHMCTIDRRGLKGREALPNLKKCPTISKSLLLFY